MAEETSRGITKIAISGFKSLRDRSEIEIRPLTILAGANSSGKSSIMQPLLLMKQTLELNYDPGAFKLDGPNVNFSSAEQMFFKKPGNTILDEEKEFTISIEYNGDKVLTNTFSKTSSEDKGIEVIETIYQVKHSDHQIRFEIYMSAEELLNQLPEAVQELQKYILGITTQRSTSWRIIRDRCFLNIGLYFDNDEPAIIGTIPFEFFPLHIFTHIVRDVIHVPGLRGNPKRSYPSPPVTGVEFEGTFENYVAGIISHWIRTESVEHLTDLGTNLGWRKLGLASGIGTRKLDDAQIELRVGRTLQSDGRDTVNIADVGFGVSQILPVLVALLVAEPNQLVYVEQPELHLHPRAQVALAQVLADAANRGVRIVVETHSSLLLLGLQTLIAEGKLSPDKTILHWFTRDDDGVTTIRSEVPDENGAYGDWPVDFDDVELKAQKRYLDAVAAREMGM